VYAIIDLISIGSCGYVPLRARNKNYWQKIAGSKETNIHESHLDLAKEILGLLNLAVDVSDEICAYTSEWTVDDVQKFGFSFGTSRAKAKNIHMKITLKNNSHEKVYIGKNESGESEIARRDSSLTTITTLAATPNQDMVEFLESTIMLAVALASVLGLRVRGSDKFIELLNQFLEVPKKTPLGIPPSDYLDIMLRTLFNRRVVVRESSQSEQ